jgi:hypothetical protein
MILGKTIQRAAVQDNDYVRTYFVINGASSGQREWIL